MPLLDKRRQWQSRPALDKPPVGGADSAELTQFLSRISAPSAPRKAAYAALIDGLVADGVWAKIDVLHVEAAADSATSVQNLRSSSFTLTNHGATFSADAGWSGNGTSAWMDTGFDPSSVGSSNFKNDGTQGCFAAYIQTNDTAGGFTYALHSGGNVSFLVPLFAGDIYSGIGGGGLNNSASGTTRGSSLIVRTAAAANSMQTFKNGAAVAAAGGTATVGVSVGAVALFANSGGSANFLNVQMSASMIGGALTPTEALAYMTRINAYMSALAINTY